VTINGVVFTAHATVTTKASRQFSISGNDTQDGDELAACINDATYGVPGVTAANSTGTITRILSETNLVLPVYAKDRAAWEAYEAMVERHAAVAGTGDVRRIQLTGPQWYAYQRDALVASKAWIAAHCGEFVMLSNGFATLEAWSEANPTNDFPPLWTPEGLCVSNGLPTNWLSVTPWQYLYGEGTNTPQWDGVRRCLDSLRWTTISNFGVWGSSTGQANPYVQGWEQALEYAASNSGGSANMLVSGGRYSVASWEYGLDESEVPAWGVLLGRYSGGGTVATQTVRNVRAAQVDVYLRCAAPGWTNNVLAGNPYPTNLWTLAETLTATTGGVFFGTTVHGEPSALADWPDDPTAGAGTNNATARGYILQGPVLVIRHDVTNGLRFR
jgi:hypothetical protein